MVKVNTAVPQQGGDNGVCGCLAVDIVAAGIVLEGFTRNDEIRIRDYFVATPRLLERDVD